MRAALREMRPFFAKSLPGILARYYDKVRHYDPSSGIFKNGTMHEAIRMQLQHWELIAACNFGPDYLASATRFCELNQRAGVAPQWYVGGRQMFIADQLMKAADNEIAIPRFGRAAQAARDRKALMLNAIAKAMMMDTQNIIAAYFGSNRQLRKDAIAEASDRFRTIITSLSTASTTPRGLRPWSPTPRKTPPTTCNRWHRRPKNSPVRCARFRGRFRSPTASPPAPCNRRMKPTRASMRCTRPPTGSATSS